MIKNFTVDDFIMCGNVAGIPGMARPVYVDNEKQIVIAYDRNKGVFFAIPFLHSVDVRQSEKCDTPIICDGYYSLFVENIFNNVPEVMEFFNYKLEEKFNDSGIGMFISFWTNNLKTKETDDERKE